MARVTRRAGRMLSTESSTRAMATRSNTRVTGGAGGPSTSRRGSRRTSTGTTNNSTDGISNRVIQRRRSSTASPAAAQAPRRRRQVREPTPESESDEDEVEDSVTIYSAVPDNRVEAFISFGSDSEMSFINVHGNNVTINISSTADDDSNVDADEENDEEDDEEESDEEEEILPHDREMSPVDLHDEEDEVLSRPDENENPNVISTEMFGDCTICLEDKPQDPVGCLHCQQLVGCRKCVMKWYNTSSSIEAKKLCPLCRHKWEQRPEVCTMFDLVITS